MRNITFFSIIYTILILNISGCTYKTPQPEDDFKCRVEGALAPQWACGSSKVAGMLSVVGSAKLSSYGDIYSRNEAIKDGKEKLANLIEERYGKKYSKKEMYDLLKEVKSSATQLKYWQNPINNDIFVLIGVSEDIIN